MMIRAYKELIRIPTFEGRYEYLRLGGSVGKATFGYDRYLNQHLYRSQRWRRVRDEVITRDEACDLAHPDFELNELIIVHHMNPITLEDIEENRPEVFDLRFLVCVSDSTHKAIHYGDSSLLRLLPLERRPNDTAPWKQTNQNGRRF